MPGDADQRELGPGEVRKPAPKKTSIDELNDQAQQNFEASQALSYEQFAWQMAQAEAALARDEALKSKIAASIKDVNALFADRDPIYNTIENASYDLNRNKLVEDRGDAKRMTGFALARAGLAGGSVDTAKGAEIQDRFNDGIVDARSFAKDASNRARSRDESLRSSLLTQALSGASTGSEITGAAMGQLDANARQAPSVEPNIGSGDYYSGIANSIGQFAQLYGASTAPGMSPNYQTVNPGGGNNSYYGSVS